MLPMLLLLPLLRYPSPKRSWRMVARAMGMPDFGLSWIGFNLDTQCSHACWLLCGIDRHCARVVTGQLLCCKYYPIAVAGWSNRAKHGGICWVRTDPFKFHGGTLGGSLLLFEYRSYRWHFGQSVLVCMRPT